MYDFSDVTEFGDITSQEAVRAWAIEQALNTSHDTTPIETVIKKAAEIEKFVKEGGSDG